MKTIITLVLLGAVLVGGILSACKLVESLSKSMETVSRHN